MLRGSHLPAEYPRVLAVGVAMKVNARPNEGSPGSNRPGEVVPVILCGGSGSRLWPRSRPQAPKPFLPLIGEQSLFQEALERCSAAGFAAPLIVTGAAHVDLMQGQTAGHPVREIIVEPEPKNTAAAIGYAAERLPPDALMLVCPSDHHIKDSRAFQAAVEEAAPLAKQGYLVCVSVTAAAPETRFGYVLPGARLGSNTFTVQNFIEKPDRATAKSLIGDNAAWNAGIFAFAAASYLRELELHRPTLAESVRQAVRRGDLSANRFMPDPATVHAIRGEAIDYAVMEQTRCAAMVIADMGWSDVGDWQAVHALRPQDDNGNSTRGDVELIDCINVAVETDGAPIRCRGLQDVAIIIDKGEVLATRIDRMLAERP